MKKFLLIIFYSIFLLGAVACSIVYLYTDAQREELREQTPTIAIWVDWVENMFWREVIKNEWGVYETIRLYSPYHELQGSAEPWSIVKITVRNTNQWTIWKLYPKVSRTGNWTQELSLSKQTLGEWVHEVVVETTMGNEISREKYRIEVAYDRIQIWDTTLYVDSQFVPTWYDEDFMWQTTSLDGKDRTFLTYGCDQDNPQPQILVESYHQRQTKDACLSLSVPDEYLLFFEYQAWYEWEYLYTIDSPTWVIRDIFPLFIHYDGIVVMNLPFWNQATQRMVSLAWWWSEHRPSMRIRSWNANDIKPLYDIFVDQWRTVYVETAREKMDIALYTQRDDLKSPVFPWSYYTYRVKWLWSQWNKTNAWALTSAFPKKYGLPLENSYDSTFGLTLTLDNTLLTVYDGFQETRFDLFAMGKTINTTSREFSMNMPTVCDDAVIDIIRGSDSIQAKQYHSSWRLMLVWKWWHTNNLTISHNSSTRQFRPDQLEQWNLWHDLQGSEFLTRWTNIYMIRVYTDRWTELCSKRIAIKW